MIVTKSEFVKTDEFNVDWWKVVIVSTEEPAQLDITGADVDGMADDAGIAAGSVLITPDSNYIAFEDGVFGLKSSSGGGGGGGGEDGLITFVNNCGETITLMIGYVQSEEDLEQQNIQVVPDLEDGESTAIQMAEGWFVLFYGPAELVTISGGIEETEFQGTPLWRVTGKGSATFTVNAE